MCAHRYEGGWRDGSVFAETVFHNLKLSHADSMSVKETNKRRRKQAFVFDMGILCTLTAISSSGLIGA